MTNDIPTHPPSEARVSLLPRLRFGVQLAFTVFCLYSGWQLHRFQQWAIGASDVFLPRPPAVEGFLPISALMALKRLVLTGHYDPIHPAGLTIFLAALLLGLLLRKGFCGWICPVGFVSNLTESLGRRLLRRPLTPPVWLDLPLLSLKYLLLGFFAYLILWRMDLRGIEAFLASPYNLIVDARMLDFFLAPSRLTAITLLVLLLLSLVIKNPWCRYLCPYGGLLGLLALLSPVQVRRDPATCIDCRRCQRACPVSVPVPDQTTVRSPECLGCLDCLAACPVEDCLTTACGPRRTHPYLLPGLVLTLFLGCWLAAVLSGHWQSKVPLEELKKYYSLAAKGVIRH